MNFEPTQRNNLALLVGALLGALLPLKATSKDFDAGLVPDSRDIHVEQARPATDAVAEAIRKALSQDSHLWPKAKQIKIIATPDGKVTLQGTVSSFEQKTKIAFIAARTAGNGRVENDLEVEITK